MSCHRDWQDYDRSSDRCNGLQVDAVYQANLPRSAPSCDFGGVVTDVFHVMNNGDAGSKLGFSRNVICVWSS